MPDRRFDDLSLVQAVRDDYEGSAMQRREVCRKYGITSERLTQLSRQHGFKMRRPNAASAARKPRAPNGNACPGIGACHERTEIARRLYGELDRLVLRLSVDQQGEASERDAKTIGALATTLIRLMDLDARGSKPFADTAPATTNETSHDDDLDPDDAWAAAARADRGDDRPGGADGVSNGPSPVAPGGDPA